MFWNARKTEHLCSHNAIYFLSVNNNNKLIISNHPLFTTTDRQNIEQIMNSFLFIAFPLNRLNDSHQPADKTSNFERRKIHHGTDVPNVKTICSISRAAAEAHSKWSTANGIYLVVLIVSESYTFRNLSFRNFILLVLRPKFAHFVHCFCWVWCLISCEWVFFVLFNLFLCERFRETMEFVTSDRC